MKLVNRFKKTTALLLLLLLPSQLGWHFWPSWAIIDGVRVDFLSPTLYLSGVVLVFVLILELFFWKESIFYEFLRKAGLYVTSLVGLFILGNIFFSISPAVSIYKWVSLLGMIYLGAFVVKNNKKVFSERITVTLLGFWVFIASVLGIWQFVLQKSVGGWWYFLGERTFSIVTPGIANAFFGGQLVLRPYGSFPHPNVLAGFLGLALLFVGAEFMRKKCVKSQITRWFLLFLSVIMVVGQTALFVSLSRTAVIAYLLALFVLVSRRIWKKATTFVVVALFLVGTLVVGQRVADAGKETEPIFARMQLAEIAWKSWLTTPILGKGLGVSPLLSNVDGIPYHLRFQPPHSIFLVVLVESGILGSVIILVFILRTLKKSCQRWRKFDPLPLAICVFVLLTGVTDHYWLTLAQGNLSLVIIGGMVLYSSTS